MSAITLQNIKLLVLDFDGVFTDNRVWVFEDGREAVVCNRSDGLGIELLRKKLPIVVLSKEKNLVVQARCNKLQLKCYQGIDDKELVFKQIVEEHGVSLQETAFIGNDINDLPCLRLAGVSIAVADAHPDVLTEVNYVLKKKGGDGAIREFCDMMLTSE